ILGSGADWRRGVDDEHWDAVRVRAGVGWSDRDAAKESGGTAAVSDAGGSGASCVGDRSEFTAHVRAGRVQLGATNWVAGDWVSHLLPAEGETGTLKRSLNRKSLKIQVWSGEKPLKLSGFRCFTAPAEAPPMKGWHGRIRVLAFVRLKLGLSG